jgi:glycosyltransferase involved in cell wall biosynthesis
VLTAMSPPPSQSPRILCIAFSPLRADSRVLRQIGVLLSHGEVTTVGYGPAPVGVDLHIEVPEGASSLPETPLGVTALTLRRHEAVELKSPGEDAVRREVLASGPYDLVVANDARALPLAFAAADGAPVLADMHEWAAEERASVLIWRLLVGPYMDALCRKYLPRAAAVTSVSTGLAGLYRERYGVETELVRSAADFQSLEPSPVDPDVIRLVHSGTAHPDRNILELIEAVKRLGNRFTLDLYLIEVPGAHLEVIRKKAATTPRVTVHPPVSPESLPVVLNQYDLGVFLYPIKTLSHLYHLPNKFFDFVQARLGLVFSPAPEIDAHIGDYDLGLITRDASADALVETLRDITADQVGAYKAAADRAARALSSEPDQATQHALVARLLARRS